MNNNYNVFTTFRVFNSQQHQHSVRSTQCIAISKHRSVKLSLILSSIREKRTDIYETTCVPKRDISQTTNGGGHFGEEIRPNVIYSSLFTIMVEIQITNINYIVQLISVVQSCVHQGQQVLVNADDSYVMTCTVELVDECKVSK